MSMTDAETLFNDTWAGCLSQWGIILSFRTAVFQGLEAGKAEVAKQHAQFVDGILKGSEYDGVFIDKEAFFKELPADKFATEMTRRTIEQASVSVDAASIVFTHSVLDAAALDYCKVTALVAPKDWEASLEQRQVTLGEVSKEGYEAVLGKKLSSLLEQLERESLIKKVELLFARCQPPTGFAPIGHYTFDMNRLKWLDNLRHAIIHGQGLGAPIASAADEVEFLMKTSLFLMCLINEKYGMKLNPLYAFSVMSKYQGKAT